ncbi:helix-turn-helix transcriptional regulator [Streptomyces sp. TRM 70361]|uniref:helix-turn-helix domain-containing protein n=1 Tax=Streptomyces sp. TRM 70361 TaxID=3116553 RepID=UPI002E7C1699|nr:helix-turn-helix transcriptional regulator [Streptomyces sp. TRM 70361]MEE1938582.1 helix-turn-helix transcriptional regulator [Streptomyces sp. TRM 70361]
MAAPHRPTARRIALGHELRELRRRVGMSLQEASKGMPFSDTKLQRVETGLQDLRSAGALRKLLIRYGMTDEEEIERLITTQRTAASQEWWMLNAANMPSGVPRFLGIEAAAQEVRAYHPTLVLGLLQTEAYARARHEGAKSIDETTTEFIEDSVSVRMMRKEALTRGEDPLRLWAILYEPALRHVVGGVEVMREQYEEIDRLAALDNVTVQVLPQTMRGHLFEHDFSLMFLRDAMPTTIQVDGPFNATFISDKRREAGRFSRHFEALSRSALPSEETPKFLHRLSREIKE